MWSELWSKRVQYVWSEIRKYGRYMFNDHLVLVVFILFGGLLFSYQQWTETLDENFPVIVVLAIVLATGLTYSPIYTLFEPADQVFLLPAENKMRPYYLKSIQWSFIIQSYILFFLWLFVLPMYKQIATVSIGHFIGILIVLLFIKGWNLFVHWNVLKLPNHTHVWIDSIVRYLINGIFIYVLLHKSLMVIGVILLFLLYGWYFQKSTTKLPLQWERLIQREEKRKMSFYRFANLFTDVPKLKGQIKRRKWADFFLRNVPFSTSKTYDFLFIRMFLRNNEYFYLVVRLTAIGSFLIWLFRDMVFGQMIVAVLFMYMTGLQLLPLWRYHRQVLWTFIYPVQSTVHMYSYLRLLRTILLIQLIVFVLVLVATGAYAVSGTVLIGQTVLIWMFVKVFAKKHVKKQEDR